MLNAFHSPQSIALIGATSEIGLSILKALPKENLSTCVLVARDPAGAEAAARAILPATTKIVTIPFEATEHTKHSQTVDQLFSEGDVDIVVLAAGVLGNNPDHDVFANALEVMQVNYVACAQLALLIAEKMKAQGHGRIQIISSFAQTRPRIDNYLYGSSKAGLDFMARGLNDALHGTGVSVCILRPGFVRTKMTKGMAAAPFAVSSDSVGKSAVELLRSDSVIGYAPALLKYVALVFANLPKKIFTRITAR